MPQEPSFREAPPWDPTLIVDEAGDTPSGPTGGKSTSRGATSGTGTPGSTAPLVGVVEGSGPRAPGASDQRIGIFVGEGPIVALSLAEQDRCQPAHISGSHSCSLPGHRHNPLALSSVHYAVPFGLVGEWPTAYGGMAPCRLRAPRGTLGSSGCHGCSWPTTGATGNPSPSGSTP